MARKKKTDEQTAVEQAIASEPVVLTPDRAAGRFHQIAGLEKDLAKVRRRIADKQTELKTLKEQESGVLETILAAARDEGDVPLNFEG